MKKILSVLMIVVFVFALSACSGSKNTSPTEPVTPMESVEETNSEKPVHMYIDIDDKYHGYYGLMSGGTVEYDEELNTYFIYLDDPALLYFKVSEENYPGGIGMITGEERAKLLNTISDFLSNNEVDENTKSFIESLQKQIEEIVCVEGAST